MTVTELLHGVQAEIGGREIPDFYLKLNQEIRVLARKRRWRAFQATYEFDTVENYTDGTVSLVGGSDTVTGTDTTWTSAMIGRKLRVDGYLASLTIESVPGATSLVLDTEWPYDDEDDKTYSIFQDEYTLPDDFEAALSVWDIENNRYLDAIPYVDAHRYHSRLGSTSAISPSQYSIWQGDTLILHHAPVSETRLSLYYNRKPLRVTKADDELDIPDYLQDLVELAIRRVYLMRYAAEDESFLARARDLNASMRDQFRVSAAMDNDKAPILIRNERTNF